MFLPIWELNVMNNYWSNEFLRPQYIDDVTWNKILLNFFKECKKSCASSLPSLM
jgi:hypothetical protein